MSTIPSQSESESAFGLLDPGIQRQLYRMQWTALRPIQVKAIRSYLRGNTDILITADTAGGKTEAAFLPVLSQISKEPKGSIRAMYVGPLKALINDQFGRLEDLCTHIEVPVFRWHGDVSMSHKKALEKNPGGVLLITPESLESILINRTSALPRLFGGLRAVVIDELHSFLGNERGTQLASLLSRIRRYTDSKQPPFRIIGLSATIGDIQLAQQYISHDNATSVSLIDDEGESKPIQMRLHGYSKLDDPESDEHREPTTESAKDNVDDAQQRVMWAIAGDLVKHCGAFSNLVFANAKGDIEIYADMANEHCRDLGVLERFLVHHGSLAKEVREDTEIAMKSGRTMTTVCSSTLEMGIDIGAVRLIGQVGAPWSVASLKQRTGRSGRKEDEPRRLRVYVIDEATEKDLSPAAAIPVDVLQAIAACELMLKKWVEPPRLSSLDVSTLTHQTMSTIAEMGATAPQELFHRLCEAGPFRAFTPQLFARILRQLGKADILEQGPDGKLILGLEGERIRSRYDFYAVFDTAAEYTVATDDRVLGTLPIATLPKVGEHIVFAARRWQVRDVDTVKMILYVQPAKRRKRPKFLGSSGDVHARIREEMRLLLLRDDIPTYLDSVATKTLQAARRAAQSKDLARRRIMSVSDNRSVWFTWTSTTSQRALKALLALEGVEFTDQEIAIECKCPASDLMRRLEARTRSGLDALELAQHVAPKQFRKYDRLFEDDVLDAAIAKDRIDCHTAGEVIAESTE